MIFVHPVVVRVGHRRHLAALHCYSLSRTLSYFSGVTSCFNPFTAKSDQYQISSATSPEIQQHTVWITWFFIAYSDERWLYHKHYSHYLTYAFLFKGWENVLFWNYCRSERANNHADIVPPTGNLWELVKFEGVSTLWLSLWTSEKHGLGSWISFWLWLGFLLVLGTSGVFHIFATRMEGVNIAWRHACLCWDLEYLEV